MGNIDVIMYTIVNAAMLEVYTMLNQCNVVNLYVCLQTLCEITVYTIRNIRSANILA